MAPERSIDAGEPLQLHALPALKLCDFFWSKPKLDNHPLERDIDPSRERRLQRGEIGEEVIHDRCQK